MTARRNRATTPELTAAQARYILEKLIDERKVTAADVQRHVAGMWDEMGVLEKRLAELRDAAEPLKHPVRAARKVGAKVKAAARRVTAERRASMKLQGRYLSLLRQIPEKQRARYQKLAKDEGRESAINQMSAAVKKT